MQYRTLGKTGLSVSILGFGTMRLPQRSSIPSDIDERLATSMLRKAIDNGVNYVDTAWPYHGKNSENFVGKALQKGYREKVYIATKSPTWLLKTKTDFRRILEKQLEKLKTDHIDLYLIHAISEPYMKIIRECEVIEEAARAKKEGLIGHIGFSFHDEFPLFKTLIDSFDIWEFCQIQYNYMDSKFQAGTAGLKYAAERGLGVVVMEPLRGGQLTVTPSEKIGTLLKKLPWGADPVEAALRWVWDQPEVSVLLSGMSAPSHVDQNLAIAGNARPGVLTAADRDTFRRIEEAYRLLCPIPCTKCRYCMPCPNGVSIPDILEMYNERVMYDNLSAPGRTYNLLLPPANRADKCVQCGQCEEACPQKIPIMEWLPKIHKELSAWSGLPGKEGK